ncbi:hypothetical protein M422DRAFT_30904 [Sphaerobolus stellatus SS14]|uniref:Uncharacterized protein n=1 Tax=Sphaerobolus stellatus (strain SS14) TaxID=990650 RepID=A0A0C9UKA9_SPHS4|nr:hypothetical protein M422DRAFT_30904 [Sphaerobolus stellatus SS14]
MDTRGFQYEDNSNATLNLPNLLFSFRILKANVNPSRILEQRFSLCLIRRDIISALTSYPHLKSLRYTWHLHPCNIWLNAGHGAIYIMCVQDATSALASADVDM